MDFWPSIKPKPHPDAPINVLREAARQFTEKYPQLRGEVFSESFHSEQGTRFLRHILRLGRDTDKITLGEIVYDVVAVEHAKDCLYPVCHDILGERSEMENVDDLRITLKQHFKSNKVQGTIRNLLDLYVRAEPPNAESPGDE